MNLARLWSISSQVFDETFISATLSGAGKQKERILEKYDENIQQLRKNSRRNSIFTSLILISPATIAIQGVNRSLSYSNIEYSQAIFANSMAIGGYYLFNAVFLILFGSMLVSNLFSGKPFEFLQTLPISESELQKIGVFTFIRILRFQILVMYLVFPLGVGFVTQSISLFIISFVINFVNITLIVYLLILTSKMLPKLLANDGAKISIKSIFRYLFLVFFILFSLFIFYFLRNSSNLVLRLYENINVDTSNLELINIVMSVIFFPFSSSYLLSQLILDFSRSNLYLLGSTLIGMTIFIFLTILLIRKGNSIILDIAMQETNRKQEEDHQTTEEVKITTWSPRIAYIRTNLIIILRDSTSTLRILMGLLFPLLTVLQESNQSVLVSFIFYSGFVLFILDNAYSSTEENMGGVLSSLPFPHIDMFRSKHLLISTTYIISFLIQLVVTGGGGVTLPGLLSFLFIAYLGPQIFLIMKSAAFGKINDEYTLYTKEQDVNYFKYFIVIIPTMIIMGAIYLSQQLIFSYFSPVIAALVFIGVHLIIILSMELPIRYMFKL